MALTPGTRLGVFTITSQIGVGGMGEVYQATDTTLKRQVAIKVLPASVAGDADRLARFQREAEVLAALNHPNIAAIYGLEKTPDLTALVMELVEGDDLSERISAAHRLSPSAHGLPLDEALPIARQIAEALEAAHEQGIIHRDLKPANIKVRSDGTVKVLDFGLAKALAPAAGSEAAAALANSPTLTSPGAMTATGVILGTAAYMSPEQARGRTVDRRADIWAFGCVLYEMLSGEPAFRGDTVSDTIAAILGRGPDLAALPDSLAPGIRRVLDRCLTKDLPRRLRDIGDARLDLDELSVPAAVATSLASRGARAWPVWRGVAVVAAVAVAATAGRFSSSVPPAPLSEATINRLTDDTGWTQGPSLSSDGKLLAYASDRAGKGDLDIWVKQTADGAPLQLTDDSADDYDPSFSPDGSQIVFRSERAGGGVYLVSTLGGNARLVAPLGRRPRLSPDGTSVAYFHANPRSGPTQASEVFVLSLSGGTPTRLLTDYETARDPIWAPDGRAVLVLARPSGTSPLAEDFDWWWVPLDGRPPRRSGLLDLLNLRTAIALEPAGIVGNWTDSGVAIAADGGVWLVPMSVETGGVSGPPKRLSLGAGRAVEPWGSVDGSVAFSLVDSLRVIQRASIADANAVPVTLYSDRNGPTGRPSETPDGATIVFDRQFGRSHEIWVKDAGSGQQRMVLRTDSVPRLDAVISPDGLRIGYSAGATPGLSAGTSGFVVDTSGGVPKKICDQCDVHGFLADSRRVLIVPTDRRSLRLLDVTTGKVEEIVRTADGTSVDRPHVSPDEHWLAFRMTSGVEGKSYVTAFAPGSPPPPSSWRQIEEPTSTGRPAGWSSDSQTLYLVLDTDGFRCVWGQRIDPVGGRLAGPVFAARHLHGLNGVSTSFGNSITRDGFLYEAAQSTGTIWRLTPRKPVNTADPR